MSRHRSQKRPWLAAVLAFIYPGLGHAYLREWLRAVVWFGLIFTTTALAIPTSAVPSSGGFSLDAVMQATQQLPIEVKLALLALSVLNIVDAYRLARQRHQATETGTTRTADGVSQCPHCGRETDADLEFCQWCTEPLVADTS